QNVGNTATAVSFNTALYVDGVLRNTWHSDPPLVATNYVFILDYSIGTLSAGTHTIKIGTDSTGVIAESNESDNEYTKTITVMNLPTRTPTFTNSPTRTPTTTNTPTRTP